MSRMYDQDTQDVSLLAKDQYMRFVRWTPDLTRQEETELIERVERGKVERRKPCPDARILEDARQARDRLVEGFQPLVIHIAKRVAPRCKSLEFLDLVQEGNLGLLQAIEDNDVGEGKPLRALAIRCINHALYHAMTFLEPPIRLGHRVHKVLDDAHKAQKRLLRVLGRDPSHAEVAGEIGISEKRLLKVLRLVEQQEVKSLQSMLYEDQTEDERDFVSLFEAETMAEKVRRQSLQEAVQQAIDTALHPRHRQVIRLRYGFEDEDGKGCCKSEVAEKLGVDRGTVRVRERKALAQLRQVLQDGEVA